jgi:predicted kinase
VSIPAQHPRYNAVMSVISDSARPLLVLVSGKPGSGKSMLAGRLADALSLPLVSRDAIKGGLAETLGGMGDAATLASVGVFYGAITYLLDAGVSLVAEQSFRRGLDERHLQTLTQRARTVVVHCHTPVEEAQRRFIARDRARGGGAAHIVAQMERGVFGWAVFDPLDVGAPTLRVDTTQAYAPGLDAIIAFCRGNPVGG